MYISVLIGYNTIRNSKDKMKHSKARKSINPQIIIPFIIPALAFLYSPLTSRSSQTLSGVSTNTSKNGRPASSLSLRARSRS